MSNEIASQMADVWIDVTLQSAAMPSKYFGLIATAHAPFGAMGPVTPMVRFNLTAYVRDMIAEAMEAK